MSNPKKASSAEFVKQIISKNISFLSSAITLIESNNSEHKQKATEILNDCLPYANKSIRIGITGVPGVGKSSFIDVFGKYLTSIGKRVAVLAVDPSSSINKGSILGDKTRMHLLAQDSNAYIRPSPSGDSLGGVARKTKETIVLCEAAGFDIILIETVGVGQSEIAVHNMVDFFLLLKLANSGDELQGIKRGIMEMADAIVINKADGPNINAAELAKSQFSKALHLYPLKESKWTPVVNTCSSLENKGIKEVYAFVNEFITFTKKNGYFYKHRKDQNNQWLLDTIDYAIKKQFYERDSVQEAIEAFKEKIEKEIISPFEAAQQILDLN
ncbi:methylmalonyl Co-A mutase-associated GTPase MeaB [Urechidicola vernalis]|uniref:Methylmalonyl Co-A mutase-associated GTPase MeaB n=1 Tax=Urechidicola vernalis TaxID=3075600 RepID=A0ABU2Y3D8_9FLAO|nr:methylmalonyl Co-A mutase-associated GTPase MeaB [Urechidicola sp. P050]MDT0552164.1 methylmalonyl Co-A mutase-associated GTPase MeaB [Urechidicola sp. P050]